MMAIILGLLVLLPVSALAADRVDVYTKDGQRQGWAVVDEQTGRVDIYDKDGRRTGYGLTRDDRLDLFDTTGRRQSVIIRRDRRGDDRRP
jgi:hypothetical protein